MPVWTRKHVPSLTGYVGEKLYVDLVSMSETMKGNRYMPMAVDSFRQYCQAYRILNKEAHTMLKVLMDQHLMFMGFGISCTQIRICEQFMERVMF